MRQMRMPRCVMAAHLSAPCPVVHGISLDGRRVRPSSGAMSRETLNLICAELPGTEKVREQDGTDVWTLAHEPFARVSDQVEVREGPGWTALPPLDDRHLRERIVTAYEADARAGGGLQGHGNPFDVMDGTDPAGAARQILRAATLACKPDRPGRAALQRRGERRHGKDATGTCCNAATGWPAHRGGGAPGLGF